MHTRLLTLTLRWSLRRPTFVLLSFALMTLIAVFALPGLKVKSGHSSMVGDDNVHYQRLNDFVSEFGSPNLTVLIVEGGDEAARRMVMDRVGAELPARHPDPSTPCRANTELGGPGCVGSVVTRVALGPMARNAVFYPEADDVNAMVNALDREVMGVDMLKDFNGLASLFNGAAEGLEDQSEGAEAVNPDDAKEAMSGLARAIDVLRGRLAPSEGVERGDLLTEFMSSQSSDSLQIDGLDAQGYLSSRDGSLKLALLRMVVEDDEPTATVPFIDHIRSHTQTLASEVKTYCAKNPHCDGEGLRVKLTGKPAIAADENRVIKRDIAKTSVFAILGVMLFFLAGFRSFRLMLVGVIPLIPAVVITLAVVRFAFEYLNIVTSGFIAVIIGLGVDFSVYVLSRFREARLAGYDRRDAAEQAVLGAGPALITGGLTTACAFLALYTSEFRAFSELGLMGCVGVVAPLLTTLLLLPALLSHPSLRWLTAGIPLKNKPSRLANTIPYWIKGQPWAFLTAAFLVVATMSYQGQSLRWSYDYMALLGDDIPSVRAWRELSEKTVHSTEVVSYVVPDVDQARRDHEALSSKATVARVETISNYLPTNQGPKLSHLARLKPALGEHDVSAITRQPIEVGSIKEAMEGLHDTLEDLKFEAKRANATEAAFFDAPIRAMSDLRAQVDTLSDADAVTLLAELQTDLLDLRDDVLSGLKQGALGRAVTTDQALSALPPDIRTRLVSGDGRYAIYVYPKGQLVDEPTFTAFVNDVRVVAPEATGFPMTHWETVSAIRASFQEAGLLTLFTVLALLFFDFRSVKRGLLAALPLAFGLVFAWGAMALLGMSYSPPTVIAFPLIVGIGVDAGVHILHRFEEEGGQDIIPVVRHTGRAVFMSTGTTMLGLGSLGLAGHAGMSGMGIILFCGMGAALIGATVILPALLSLLAQRRAA